MQTQELSKVIEGKQIFRNYDLSSFQAKALEFGIQLFLNMPLKWRISHYYKYTQLIEELRKKYLVREMIFHNLVTTVGRSVIAQRLAGTVTYTGTVNYGALGSSSTAVANGDTQLNTEVFRKAVASASYTTNVGFIDFFYSKADTSGTYQEFGTFIDGTGSANTGQLFSHLLTGGWTKLASESMTVSCQYTIS